MRSAFRLRLTDIEAVRSLKERPTNPDAFDLFLRARAIYFLPQTEGHVARVGRSSIRERSRSTPTRSLPWQAR